MKKSFEEALEEIESIVTSMEKGDLSLDESIKQYEKGMRLIVECNRKLLSAEKTIKIIEQDLNGNLVESGLNEMKKENGSETLADFEEQTAPVSKKKKNELSARKSERKKEIDPNDTFDSELPLF